MLCSPSLLYSGENVSARRTKAKDERQQTLETSAGPALFPRRPALVNVRVRVRDRRFRLAPLCALFVLVRESERVTRGLRGRPVGTAGEVGWAIEPVEVA